MGKQFSIFWRENVMPNVEIGQMWILAAILKRNNRFSEFLFYKNSAEMVHICVKFDQKQ